MTLVEASNLFFLLSNPERLGILQLLLSSKEGLTPSFLSARLSCSDDCVFKHLKRLRENNLVTFFPSGTNHLYFANRTLIGSVLQELNSILGDSNANS